MHNCNATKNDLVELALSQTDQNQLPPAELENCPGCREELSALRNALRMTEAAIQSSQPAQSFWPGYHERLCQRLELEPQSSNGWLPPTRFNLGLWLRRIATTSIPVPIPVLSVFFVFIIFSILFIVHARQSSGPELVLTPPSVITKTIEVPVVQEKLVTRVVYRKIQTPPTNMASRQRDGAGATGYPSSEPPVIVQGLEGFKPANEVKLTIIKGSYQNEK
jgi:hypothetical protein